MNLEHCHDVANLVANNAPADVREAVYAGILRDVYQLSRDRIAQDMGVSYLAVRDWVRDWLAMPLSLRDKYTAAAKELAK